MSLQEIQAALDSYGKEEPAPTQVVKKTHFIKKGDKEKYLVIVLNDIMRNSHEAGPKEGRKLLNECCKIILNRELVDALKNIPSMARVIRNRTEECCEFIKENNLDEDLEEVKIMERIFRERDFGK